MQESRLSTRHLDGLRIIAACAVVVLHYSDYVRTSHIGGVVFQHAQHLNLFVDLFFVISGFVIASQYLGKVSNPTSIGRFLWRRLARIYPLHLATLAFYILLAALLQSGLIKTENPARYPLSDIPAQLLLLHAVVGQRLTFNFPSWSLSAEMICYLVFPIIAIIAARHRRPILMLVAISALANTLYGLATDTMPWADWINRGGAFRALPAFSLGVACHLYRHQIARWRFVPGSLTFAVIAFVALGWQLPEMAALATIYAIAVLAIHCDCSNRSTLLTRLDFARWSSLTYSLYMLHVPVATVVMTLGAHLLFPHDGIGKLILLPLAILVLAVASIASYRIFETPARQALNETFDRYLAGRTAIPALVSSKDSR